jgi:hypothetical protein
LGDHLPPESVITIDRNTHPLSPRIRTLGAILAKLEPPKPVRQVLTLPKVYAPTLAPQMMLERK